MERVNEVIQEAPTNVSTTGIPNQNVDDSLKWLSKQKTKDRSTWNTEILKNGTPTGHSIETLNGKRRLVVRTADGDKIVKMSGADSVDHVLTAGEKGESTIIVHKLGKGEKTPRISIAQGDHIVGEFHTAKEYEKLKPLLKDKETVRELTKTAEAKSRTAAEEQGLTTKVNATEKEGTTVEPAPECRPTTGAITVRGILDPKDLAEAATAL